MELCKYTNCSGRLRQPIVKGMYYAIGTSISLTHLNKKEAASKPATFQETAQKQFGEVSVGTEYVWKDGHLALRIQVA